MLYFVLRKAHAEVKYTKVQLASLLGGTMSLGGVISLRWSNSVSAPGCFIMVGFLAGVLCLEVCEGFSVL